MLSLIHITLLLLLTTTLILTTARLLTILPRSRRGPRTRQRDAKPTHLLIVLGSGGHTAEMLAMLHGLDTHAYRHRTYVVSAGDPISAAKARAFELDAQQRVKEDKAAVESGTAHYGSYTIATIPRARHVHQPLVTAPFTCLRSLFAALYLLYHGAHSLPDSIPRAPDLILTNGPATSAILVYASVLLRFLDFSGSSGHANTRIIYAESFARISSLSLSAKVVAWAVDRLLVQWEQLEGAAGGKAEFVGLLVMDGLRTTPVNSSATVVL